MIEILENHKLQSQTSMKVGGNAKYYAEVSEVSDFEKITQFLSQNLDLPVLVVGACTNLVISDSGYGGLVIKNSIDFVDIDGVKVEVGAGMLLPKLAMLAINEGLSGLERVGNVPGTVGGAIWGNAEANHQSISDKLVSVVWGDFADGLKTYRKDECEFDYRSSIFKTDLKGKGIILSAKFCFDESDVDKLRVVWEEDKRKRMKAQPTDWSCGCFFKNIVLTTDSFARIEEEFGIGVLADRMVGDNFSAGRLIDLAGLKGECRGDACMSEVHANFLINKGKATAKDVYELFLHIQYEIEKRVGVKLENEVQFAGEFNK